MTRPRVAALAFAEPSALDTWFADNHVTTDELWVRLYRKESGVPSVTWDDCVHTALAWGWIDGLKRSEGECSWVQRITPRRRGSRWSARNRDIAEGLIASGRMRPTGLAAVRAAQAGGRWGDPQRGN